MMKYSWFQVCLDNVIHFLKTPLGACLNISLNSVNFQRDRTYMFVLDWVWVMWEKFIWVICREEFEWVNLENSFKYSSLVTSIKIKIWLCLYPAQTVIMKIFSHPPSVWSQTTLRYSYHGFWLLLTQKYILSGSNTAFICDTHLNLLLNMFLDIINSTAKLPSWWGYFMKDTRKT